MCYFSPESKKISINLVVSEFTMAFIWVKGKTRTSIVYLFKHMLLHIQSKIDTWLHVNYVANSLNNIPTVLYDSKGTLRFGMITTTKAIIVVETMYVG